MPVTQKIAPLLLGEREAGRMLSLSSRSMYNMRRSGRIPFLRIGGANGAVRYALSDLETFVAENRQQAAK